MSAPPHTKPSSKAAADTAQRRQSKTRESGADGKKARTIDPARRLALALLAEVTRGRPLDEALEAEEAGLAVPGVRGADLSDQTGKKPEAWAAIRARAQRLAAETLRQAQRADCLLAPLLKRAPPEPVRFALRLAVVEHHALGAPAHAVVDSLVDIFAADPVLKPFAGLANAVLRRSLQPCDWQGLPVPKLPSWIRKRLRAAYSEKVVAAIEQAHLAGPALDLSLKPEVDPGPLVAQGFVALPGGSLRTREPVQISALPGYAAGAFWVQEAAAAQPARALLEKIRALPPSVPVLDLCAAPGGKTLQLASAGRQVIAVDVSPKRLERLRENLVRLRLAEQVTCVAADLRSWTPPEPARAVLIDLPCTATGTIRRHPELPFLRREKDLARVRALQDLLLDRAASFLAVGGVMAVATCSLLPDEGEEMVHAFLERHPELVPLPVTAPLGEASGPGWRTRPDHLPEAGGLDGFFFALVARRA